MDKHPNIIGWGSEVQTIPYFNPTKGRRGMWSVYIPDFLVISIDAKNNKMVRLIEIKPISQTPGYQKIGRTGNILKSSKLDQMERIVNAAKWKAALVFCAKRGWKFEVMTQETLFGVKKAK